ncbi:MAG: cytochrome B [Gammaproteobacteria bacterium]|nr:MAG: cytochrome B [Gammaproteobacteria bacterium]
MTVTEVKMQVKVWDVPTRLYHWAFAGVVIAQFVTAQLGGDAMFWHVRLGYAALALVLFRIYWGLVGSESARFSHFLAGPSATLAYMRDLARRHPPAVASHNPMGGWAVIALLLAVGTQATLGLFSNDDIFIEGPLYGLISKDLSDSLTGWHGVGAKVIVALVGLHLLAIAVHQTVFREQLVPAMLHGNKPLEQPVQLRFVSPWRALPGLLLAVLAVWALVTWGESLAVDSYDYG